MIRKWGKVHIRYWREEALEVFALVIIYESMLHLHEHWPTLLAYVEFPYSLESRRLFLGRRGCRDAAVASVR